MKRRVVEQDLQVGLNPEDGLVEKSRSGRLTNMADVRANIVADVHLFPGPLWAIEAVLSFP